MRVSDAIQFLDDKIHSTGDKQVRAAAEGIKAVLQQGQQASSTTTQSVSDTSSAGNEDRSTQSTSLGSNLAVGGKQVDAAGTALFGGNQENAQRAYSTDPVAARAANALARGQLPDTPETRAVLAEHGMRMPDNPGQYAALSSGNLSLGGATGEPLSAGGVKGPSRTADQVKQEGNAKVDDTAAANATEAKATGAKQKAEAQQQMVASPHSGPAGAAAIDKDVKAGMADQRAAVAADTKAAHYGAGVAAAGNYINTSENAQGLRTMLNSVDNFDGIGSSHLFAKDTKTGGTDINQMLGTLAGRSENIRSGLEELGKTGEMKPQLMEYMRQEIGTMNKERLNGINGVEAPATPYVAENFNP